MPVSEDYSSVAMRGGDMILTKAKKQKEKKRHKTPTLKNPNYKMNPKTFINIHVIVPKTCMQMGGLFSRAGR